MTFEQLVEAGFSRRQVQHAERIGRLRRLHRGVFLVGQFPLPFTAEMAAVLACGDKAVLSHASAAHLYELLPYPAQPGEIDVTVQGRHGRAHPGIRCHRASSLHPHELRERHGIPVTSPIRTLVDLAATCSQEDLQEAVAEAFALNLTNLAALQRATRAYRGRRGIARLAAILDGGGPRRTRSNPERVLLRGVRRAGLPEPETNVRLGRWEVDFLWREAGLIVEVDAYSTHSSPRAFERDRRKDAELAATGLSVQRFTADRIRSELDAVIGWIAQRLSAASSWAA